MRKSFLLILIILFLLVAPVQGQGELSVTLVTEPSPGQIGPDATFAKTILTVVDSNGQTVPNAYLKLHLDSPAGNPFISTDFPIVENTPLMNYEGILPDGILEFEYIYPIRGSYGLEIVAGRSPSALSFRDTLTVNLRENGNELVNFIILLMGLLGLGVAAGVIIGRGARAQRVGIVIAIVILMIGLVNRSASSIRAHGGGDVSGVEPVAISATNDAVTLTYGMDPGAGRVGTLNELKLRAMDGNGNLIPETTFELAFWHIEDDKPVFRTNLYTETGEADLKFQFFDGAEHEVRLAASNILGTANLNTVIEVEGISPPLTTKAKTTFYLVLIAFIGILIGLRLQGTRRENEQLVPIGA